jgi:hypothetical protein
MLVDDSGAFVAGDLPANFTAMVMGDLSYFYLYNQTGMKKTIPLFVFATLFATALSAQSDSKPGQILLIDEPGLGGWYMLCIIYIKHRLC